MPTPGERRSAEAQRALLPEVLPCPACGYPSLLAEVRVWVVPTRVERERAGRGRWVRKR